MVKEVLHKGNYKPDYLAVRTEFPWKRAEVIKEVVDRVVKAKEERRLMVLKGG